MYSIPSAPLSVPGGLHACSRATAVAVCEAPLHLREKELGDIWPRDKSADGDSVHERSTFRALSRLTERIRRVEHLDHMFPSELHRRDTHCNRGAPAPPEL